jgi:hypothetical protein
LKISATLNTRTNSFLQRRHDGNLLWQKIRKAGKHSPTVGIILAVRPIYHSTLKIFFSEVLEMQKVFAL